jgi:hypothetical protein
LAIIVCSPIIRAVALLVVAALVAVIHSFLYDRSCERRGAL